MQKRNGHTHTLILANITSVLHFTVGMFLKGLYSVMTWRTYKWI